MKKICKIILLITLCISTIHYRNVNAMSSDDVPLIIIECIDGIYKYNEVYNINDENIKKKFIENNKLKYEKKDYYGIYDYIANNDIVFEKTGISIQTRASNTYNLTKVFVHTYQFTSEKKYTFAVECYAVVRVNENDGKITSYSGPSVSLYQPAGGGAVSESLSSVSTTKSMGSTKRSIVFTYEYAYKRIEAGSYGQSNTYTTPIYKKTLKYPS